MLSLDGRNSRPGTTYDINLATRRPSRLSGLPEGGPGTTTLRHVAGIDADRQLFA